jgi:O-antigen/teichoic acid export membrane protein
VDKLLLSRLLELSEYGEYMLAVTISSCAMMATSPIGQAAYPKFTELIAKGDRMTLAQVFHHTAQLVTLVAGSGCIVLIFFTEQIISLWTGDPELAARTAPTVRNLAAGNGVNATMALPYLCLLATGRTTFINLYSALSVAIVVPALLLIVPSSGMVGAATVWLALNIILFLVVAPISIVYALPGQVFHWYWRDLAIPTLAMISVCWILKAISGSISMGGGLAICYIGCAATATASAGCLAIPAARRSLLDLQASLRRKANSLFTIRRRETD